MTAKQVAEALGRDYEATRQLLYQMRNSGRVVTRTRGTYELPERPANNANKLTTKEVGPTPVVRDAGPIVRHTGVGPNNGVAATRREEPVVRGVSVVSGGSSRGFAPGGRPWRCACMAYQRERTAEGDWRCAGCGSRGVPSPEARP